MNNQRRIYTLSSDMMPEVKAVTFAKCSRSPEPFDQIAKELTEEKSAEFHEKWVVGYGHSSIAEHAVISLAMENISILATKVVEDCRLASYTEKSTRYQIFTKDRIYKPEKVIGSHLRDTYEQAINLLMDTYQEMTGPMREFVKKKYPQKDETDKLYEMISKARACDNIRYLLPTATLTNLGMTVNARELEHLIKKMLSHPLKEMQDIGEEIKQKAIAEMPTLVRFADKNQYLTETKEKLASMAEEISSGPGSKEPVTIVDYDKQAEDKLVVALLYPYSNLSYNEIKEKIVGLSQEKKEQIIDESLKRRGDFDAPLRELEHIFYTFDILIDYGAFRDIQRHRICTQSNQDVTVVHGYDMPPEIEESGYKKKFVKAVDNSVNAYEKISKEFPKEAQYIVPLCFRKRVLISWNLRELHHFISLRSGKKGHPSYRRIAQECWRQINKIQPLLAKYIRVDMDDMPASWAATLENKEYYFNPFAARKKT
jgi:thymidylate synthase ThyX